MNNPIINDKFCEYVYALNQIVENPYILPYQSYPFSYPNLINAFPATSLNTRLCSSVK